MLKPIKTLTTGLFIIAMVFITMPIMANTPNSDATAQVPLDSTWILAIAGVLLGTYKIYAIQKAAMISKNV